MIDALAIALCVLKALSASPMVESKSQSEFRVTMNSVDRRRSRSQA